MTKFKSAVIFAFAIILMSSLFYIPLMDKAFALSQPSVKVDPDVISQYGSYEISFITGRSLYKDSDKIIIYFPEGTVLPCGCTGVAWKAVDFTVNGVNVDTSPTASSTDRSATITVPLTIASGSNVIIDIKPAATIKNPPDIGYYTLSVATTQEDTFIKSKPYYIGYSTVSTPIVSVSPSYANVKSDINVTFKTGVLGTLLKGERVIIQFPDGFNVPPSISTFFILVNGQRVSDSQYYPRTNGNFVSVPVPSNIQANSVCKIEFLVRAGIENPVTPGEYTLKVYTDEEKTPVESNKFIISPKPKAFTNIIILPDEIPDGKNGYYIHPVTVMLVGISNIGANVTVHYSVDNGAWKKSNGNSVTIIFNNGSHVLKYYSTDTNGFKEAEKAKEFKIDTTIPNIILTQPKSNNITVSVLNYEIKGVVENIDNDTVLSINGQEIPIDGDGDFSEAVQLNEGVNKFTLLAEDKAGNDSRIVITINVSTVIPKLTIVSPMNWQEVREDNIVVSGKVDILNSTVTVNKQSVSLNNDGSFSYNLSLANEEKGSIPVKIVATAKESGLSTTKTIVIIYNPKPKEIVVKLQIGVNTASVSEEDISLDTPPFIDPTTNRTLVPLRFISEAFGADVQWDDLTRSVIVKLNDKEIKLQIGNTQASVNGEIVSLDQPPVIKNDRTMVPIRFISESLGADVQWNGDTKTITITYTP